MLEYKNSIFTKKCYVGQTCCPHDMYEYFLFQLCYWHSCGNGGHLVSFSFKKWTCTCHAKQWPTPASKLVTGSIEEVSSVPSGKVSLIGLHRGFTGWEGIEMYLGNRFVFVDSLDLMEMKNETEVWYRSVLQFCGASAQPHFTWPQHFFKCMPLGWSHGNDLLSREAFSNEEHMLLIGRCAWHMQVACSLVINIYDSIQLQNDTTNTHIKCARVQLHFVDLWSKWR